MHTGYRSLGCMHRIDALPTLARTCSHPPLYEVQRLDEPLEGCSGRHVSIRVLFRCMSDCALSRGSWRPVDEMACFWSDSTIAMLVMLTMGDDGSKGVVQRHGQAACKTRSARPTESCVPLLMQVEKLSLGEF